MTRRLGTSDIGARSYRKLFLALAVVVTVIAALAIYLILTTPKTAEPVRFPLGTAQRQLLSHLPADTSAFALIPSAAMLQAKLLANPVTHDAVEQWTEEHELPRPWMLGGADIVAWKADGPTAYAIRLDPVRAVLVRIWLLAASNAESRWEGATLILHAPAAASEAPDLAEVLRLAAGLPDGDVFVAQLNEERGAFPPIGRPAATSISVTASDIVLVSRAASDEVAEPRAMRATYPKSALLAASFSTAPAILGDLNRLVGTRIDALVGNGGSVVLYDVDTGTLLPRPRGLLVLPATPEARAQWKEVEQVATLVGEARDAGDRLLVSFDRGSMGRYLKDAQVPATWPATRWSLRIDPKRLVPILRRAGDSAGLRFAAPRIHRAVRDLRRWIGALERAQSVEAAASVTGGVEELRVRVASK